MMNRKETGYYGEDVARKVLEKRGYHLFAKNYTIRGGEIDLIMTKDEELIFVEVKTRRNDLFGSPMEGITLQKQKRMVHAAKVFLAGKDPCQYDIRFFAVAVFLDDYDHVRKVEIYEDIFI